MANVASGSYDAEQCQAVQSELESAGFHVARVVRCPDDDLPSRAELECEGVAILAMFTGDGTVNGVHERIAGWDGEILVLPGGTMNLLCKTLHDSEDFVEIIRRAPGAASAPLPTVEGEDRRALTGVIAGPTAIWGEVREAMRHGDVAQMMELIPRAWQRSHDEASGVWLDDRRERHASLFLTAEKDGLHLAAFTVDQIGEAVQHGLAWLGGDFRRGPHVDLGMREEAAIHSDETEIAMLVDGEQDHAQSPLHFRRGWSDVRFLATVAN